MSIYNVEDLAGVKRSLSSPYGKLYACTLKGLGSKFRSVEDYERILNRWRTRQVRVHNVNYELDSKEKLHLHCIANIPNKVYRKMLETNEYHMNLIELQSIKSVDKWINYIRKDEKMPKHIKEELSWWRYNQESMFPDLEEEEDHDYMMDVYYQSVCA